MNWFWKHTKKKNWFCKIIKNSYDYTNFEYIESFINLINILDEKRKTYFWKAKKNLFFLKKLKSFYHKRYILKAWGILNLIKILVLLKKKRENTSHKFMSINLKLLFVLFDSTIPKFIYHLNYDSFGKWLVLNGV